MLPRRPTQSRHQPQHWRCPASWTLALHRRAATQRRVFHMHADATTLADDGHGARSAALSWAWRSSSGAVVGAGVREDPCGLPKQVRHRQVSRRYPAIDHCLLGHDISLSQRAASCAPRSGNYSCGAHRVDNKARLNPNAEVTRPLKVVKPDSLEAAVAYKPRLRHDPSFRR
jgi:hypothetical protein